MAKEPGALCRLVRGGSRGQGKGHLRAPQELTEEIQSRTPLLPARPPHRHQDRLRPRPRPRPAAAPDLAKDDAEADRQLGPPVSGVQPRLTQEREQVVAMSPQVLGQALVGRVRLERENQVAQLVLQASARSSLVAALSSAPTDGLAADVSNGLSSTAPSEVSNISLTASWPFQHLWRAPCFLIPPSPFAVTVPAPRPATWPWAAVCLARTTHSVPRRRSVAAA